MAGCLALHGGRQLLRIGNGDLVNLLGSARSLSTPSTSAIRPSMCNSAETLYVAHIDVFQEACEGSIGRMQRKMVQGLAGCKVSVLQRLENSHEENSKARIASHL